MTDRQSLVLTLIALLAIAGPTSAWAEDPCRAPLIAFAALSADAGSSTGLEGGSGVGGTGLEGGSGVGGTGLEGGSGVGGTGLEGGSGVGGTGISIYGTITAFGSICVNGLRIHYDADVAVLVDGRVADTSALAVGEVVWVEAERGATPRARQIEVLHALIGRIDAAEPGSARLELLGHGVDILPETRLAGESGELLRVGQTVAVSGLWRDGDRVVATRIAPAPADTSHVGPRLTDLLSRSERIASLSVEGYVSARSDLGLRIDGLEVTTVARPDVTPGQRVRAMGRLTPERVLQIERPARPEVPRPPPVTNPRPPERPERPERPPRIDRPEKIERPEVFDRPEVTPHIDLLR